MDNRLYGQIGIPCRRFFFGYMDFLNFLHVAGFFSVIIMDIRLYGQKRSSLEDLPISFGYMDVHNMEKIIQGDFFTWKFPGGRKPKKKI